MVILFWQLVQLVRIVQAKLLQTCQALEGRLVGPMSYVGGEETSKFQFATTGCPASLCI